MANMANPLIEAMMRAMNSGQHVQPPPAGRSRKYRDQQQSGNFNLSSMVQVPNPVVPLRFECTSWRGYNYVGTEILGLQASFSDDYVSPAVYRAHIAALNAYSAPTWQKAEAEARAAIAQGGGLCPEGYNVLAVAAAETYEEALEFYRMAAEQGPKVLPRDRWDDSVAEKSMWPRSPYRAFIRGLYGVANTLRKMGRYQEAVERYKELLAYEPSWYQWSSFVNFTSTFPVALLGAEGPQAVLDWMLRWPTTEDHCTYLSSSIYFVATAALAELELSARTRRDAFGMNRGGARVTAEDGWAADGTEISRVDTEDSPWFAMKRGRCLFILCHHFPIATDMLLGEKAMPSSGLAPDCVGELATATSYVFTAGAQWRSRPGALDRLRKFRNTFELQGLLWDIRSGLTPSELLPDVKHYMSAAAGGFHAKAMHKIPGQRHVRGLVDYLMLEPKGKEFTSTELKVLRWLLDAGCPVVINHPEAVSETAMHMTCYQAYGPEAVKMLIAAGGNPFKVNREGLSAAAMAANQANWREVKAIFEALPHAKTATGQDLEYSSLELHRRSSMKSLTIPELMIIDLFNSSCLPCLAGGPERCMRCSNGIPHSRHADFFKFADVLAECVPDLKISRVVMQEMQGSSRMGGPGSPWANLYNHIVRAFSNAAQKNKEAKAAACTSGSSSSSASGSTSNKAPGSAGTKSNASQAAAAAAAAAGGASSSNGCSPSLPVAGSSAASVSAAPTATPTAAAATARAGAGGASRAAGKKCCWCCGATNANAKLQVCSGCKTALYCSAGCQTDDWKAHKKTCKSLRAAVAAAK